MMILVVVVLLLYCNSAIDNACALKVKTRRASF